MAKKALKKTSKVLGGLGAAYMLADQLGPRVKADPVEAARDVLATHERVQRERVDKPPAPANLPGVVAEEPSVKSRITVEPTNADVRKLMEENKKGWQETENRIDLREQANREPAILKKGGTVSASRRGDGIAQRGKTRGKMV
jgi:Ribonuclease G/E